MSFGFEVTRLFCARAPSKEAFTLTKQFVLSESVHVHNDLLLELNGNRIGPFIKCVYNMNTNTWMVTMPSTMAESEKQLLEWVKKAEVEGWKVEPKH